MSRPRRRRIQYIDRETIRLRGEVARLEGTLRNPAFRDIEGRRDAYAAIKIGNTTMESLAIEREQLTQEIAAEDKARAR